MRFRFLMVSAAVALFAASSSWAQGRGITLAVGDAAPPLEVTTIKGDPVNLSDSKGQNIVIVEFWATWCAPCKDTAPYLTALQKHYKDQGLVVIGISDETPETIRPYVKKMGPQMDYTIAADKDRQTWRRYMEAAGEEGIPHAFVVDKAGSLVWHGHPMSSFLEPLVSVLLSHKALTPPAQPSTKTGGPASPAPGTQNDGSGPES